MNRDQCNALVRAIDMLEEVQKKHSQDNLYGGLMYGEDAQLLRDLRRSVEQQINSPIFRPIKGSFQADLESLINHHSMENGSDTPDFILAEYLKQCLLAFECAIQGRKGWYSRPAIDMKEPF